MVAVGQGLLGFPQLAPPVEGAERPGDQDRAEHDDEQAQDRQRVRPAAAPLPPPLQPVPVGDPAQGLVGPVPPQVNLAQVPFSDGKTGVALQFSTAVGVAVYFLPAATAAVLADQLAKVAGAASAGLVVPA